MSQNVIDRQFLSQLNQPIYRSIIDINTYHLDRFIGVSPTARYTPDLLFQRCNQSIKKQNQSYGGSLDRYISMGYDYGFKLDCEEIGVNQFRLAIFSYMISDSTRITNFFGSLPTDVARLHNQNVVTHDQLRKKQLVPLVFGKFIKDSQNLVSLDFKLRNYAMIAINSYFSALNLLSNLKQDQRELNHIIGVLLACLIVETKISSLYHGLTRGSIGNKTLGQMLKKAFNVDRRRKNRFFVDNLFTDLEEMNRIRIRTVHPTIHPLRFPDDALTSLYTVGKFLIRCDEYGL
ncbi:MAG: hypothetical protein ACFFCW_34725 [Candidatus Hodarchaeota archaeon]